MAGRELAGTVGPGGACGWRRRLGGRAGAGALSWLLCCWAWLLLAAALQAAPLQAAAPAPLLRLDAASVVPLWPAVRWLHDARGTLDLAGARAQDAAFEAPRTAFGTLGLLRGAAWLRVALQVPDSADPADGHWIFESDHASVQHLAVYLLDEAGAVLLQDERLGALERTNARVPTASLVMQPGRRYVLLLRAQSDSPLILPLRLSRPGPYISNALAAQTVQALLAGLSLALLLYSLGQAWWHRDGLALRYAFLVGCSMTVSLAQFGLAAQFLWHGQPWALRHAAGLAALLAQCASFLYNEAVLRRQPGWRGFSRTMQLGAGVMLATAALFAADVIGVSGLSAVAGTVGMMPALLGASRAWGRLRAGDATGAYLLMAWLGYYLGVFTLMGVSWGRLPATPLTLHAFQLAAVLDLVLFLQVLVLRQRSRLARAEREARLSGHLRGLAETDDLTGLPNRRGLEAVMPGALARARPGHGLALYMIDLDGFKAINDSHGHAVGDQLLDAVAQRLRSHIRQHDLLARLGGDEFVLVAEGLPHTGQAQELGAKLLEALRAPLLPDHPGLHLGLTAGCVFVEQPAPLQVLLRQADQAMYRGKQAGRGRVEVDRAPLAA